MTMKIGQIIGWSVPQWTDYSGLKAIRGFQSNEGSTLPEAMVFDSICKRIGYYIVDRYPECFEAFTLKRATRASKHLCFDRKVSKGVGYSHKYLLELNISTSFVNARLPIEDRLRVMQVEVFDSSLSLINETEDFAEHIRDIVLKEIRRPDQSFPTAAFSIGFEKTLRSRHYGISIRKGGGAYAVPPTEIPWAENILLPLVEGGLGGRLMRFNIGGTDYEKAYLADRLASDLGAMLEDLKGWLKKAKMSDRKQAARSIKTRFDALSKSENFFNVYSALLTTSNEELVRIQEEIKRTKMEVAKEFGLVGPAASAA